MKQNRFFRILAVAIILSLLMIAIPATPVLAGSITLNPEKGGIGSSINIEGEDFIGGVRVNIYFSSQKAEVDDQIDDEVTAYRLVKQPVTYGISDIPPSGTFDTTFHVPVELDGGDDYELVHGGKYYIYSTYANSDDILSVDAFTVIGIERLTPAEGPAGTTVEIEGIGYAGDEDISIEYDGEVVDIASGDEETESDGDFICRIEIPLSIAGVHTITAIVEDKEGEFQFEVVPLIVPNPASGAPGDQITITGTGFGYKSDIIVTFDGEAIDISGDDDTDEYGSFEFIFNVPPDMSQGIYEIEVEDEDENKAVVEFSISTSLVLTAGATSDSPAHVGEEVTVSGRGFKAEWPMTITYASTPVSFTTNSMADGSFSYTFEVPPSEGGIHTITVTDGENTDQTSFFVETTPPSPVYPLLPLEDSKLEGDRFDWCGDADDPNIEVTDESLPITYELQIATNGQFNAEAILVYKIELAASEYTLTDDERQELAGEEGPYYWRVRARDAASNLTAWTSAGTFTLAFTFHFPTWLIYTLIAIVAIGLFFLGYWLGRRSTSEEYYY